MDDVVLGVVADRLILFVHELVAVCALRVDGALAKRSSREPLFVLHMDKCAKLRWCAGVVTLVRG